MKLSLRSLLFAAAMLVGVNFAQAEGLNFDSFEPFAKTSEAKLTLVDGCGEKSVCCEPEHIGKDFLTCKDRCGGIYFGAEALMYRPFASSGLLDPGAGAADLSYRLAGRGWVGYQSASGLGGRFRGFVYDHNTVTGANTADVEVRYIDAEITQQVDFRRWDLFLSGGLRHAETGLLVNTAAAGFVSGFDGVGLTFGTQAVRDINRSGSLQMVMGGRWSALYGNTKTGTSVGGAAPVATATLRDNLVNVLELNIGPQFTRQSRLGGTMVMGGGLDAQYWSNGANGAAAPVGIGVQDLGFIGFSSTFNYYW
ncbi:MAG: hypothetical protein JNK76_23245 [Planctomycetales bacterium]|nr:hypothetical protein [Planctomycetales bacterium]MBN8624023.1 hypothetical protein [Planctomycetota bacterium]